MTRETKLTIINLTGHFSFFVVMIVTGISISRKITDLSLQRFTTTTPVQVLVSSTEGKAASRNLKDIVDSHGFQGWEMPCNYYGGSSADWDEKTQQYGDQKYIECANGIVYEKIGESPSVSHFDKNDIKNNLKYCPNGGYAAFSTPDPITGLGSGSFLNCIR